jgi:hypothetical protein
MKLKMTSVLAAAMATGLAIWISSFGNSTAGTGRESRGHRDSGASFQNPSPQSPYSHDPHRLEKIFEIMESEAESHPDPFDLATIIDKVGADPITLFEWVRDNTSWVPYRGVLRGPVGVLMDGLGNSLDRSLLLGELLREAGQEVRLARGRISEDRASRLLGDWQNEFSTLLEKFSGAPLNTAPDPQIWKGTEKWLSVREREAIIKENEALGIKTSKAISRRLENLSEFFRPQDLREEAASESALNILQDHWWVQIQTEDSWQDLDPVSRKAKVGETFTRAEETVSIDDLSPELFQEVEVRVVVEKLHSGKLSEQPVLTQILQPAKLTREQVRLSFVPLDWTDDTGEMEANDSPSAIRSIAISISEWQPVLKAGTEEFTQGSFTDAGVVKVNPKEGSDEQGKGTSQGGGLTFALGGGQEKSAGTKAKRAKSESQLTAVWVDYEIRRPGSRPQKIRREFLDLLGPAERKSGTPRLSSPEESIRLTRGLALLGDIEIFLMNCDVRPEFTLQRVWSILLENQAAFIALASGGKEADDADRNAVIEALRQMPGAPCGLALGRFALSPARFERYLDSVNIFCTINKLEPGEDHQVRGRSILDIVNNEIAVRPGAKTAPFRVRLEQGVADTVVEGVSLEPGENTESAAGLFEAVDAKGNRLVLVRKVGDEGWQKTSFGEDERARMEEDLRSGYHLVAPEKTASLPNWKESGWWRIHPLTGETLGVMGSGYHQTQTQTAITDTLISAKSAAVRVFGAANREIARRIYICSLCIRYASEKINQIEASGLYRPSDLIWKNAAMLKIAFVEEYYELTGSLPPAPW